MAKEYRVMYRGKGSSLSLQLGDNKDRLETAKMLADSDLANGLRAEGCIVTIESRTVGPWGYVATNDRPNPGAAAADHLRWLKEWNALCE